MLEIIAVIMIARHASAKAKAKGLTGLWGGLPVLFWFGAEIFGVIVGILIAGECAGYVIGLVCAAIGAAVGVAIVGALPARPGFEDGAYTDGSMGQGATCPKCGSMQTEVAAGTITCFKCGANTPRGG